jgi:transcriptional regulator with GAF, ATPase, and Fis domain
VLQESEFERVGDDITKSVDVRVIAATNRDLEQLVMSGNFREDLFYRLSVFPIEVPPLRKRGDDVIQLAQHFLEATCNDFGRKSMILTKNQADEIRTYDWPGNVRELKNVIERAVILSQGNALRLDLSLPGGTARTEDRSGKDESTTGQLVLTEHEMKELQKKNLLAALGQTDWRVSGKDGAAELLGVRPTTLSDRIKSLGLHKPRRH